MSPEQKQKALDEMDALAKRVAELRERIDAKAGPKHPLRSLAFEFHCMLGEIHRETHSMQSTVSVDPIPKEGHPE